MERNEEERSELMFFASVQREWRLAELLGEEEDNTVAVDCWVGKKGWERWS